MILKDIRINSIQTSETTLTLKSESIYSLKLLKEKIRSITFIVWMLGRVEKNVNKQGQNNEKTYFLFKQISKCDKCFYIHFSKALKKYSLQICSFSRKKLWAILEFFFPNWTFSALYSTLCVKKKLIIQKKSSNYYSLKVTKFHGDSVKNESSWTKKTTRGAKRPPLAFLG